MFLHVKGSFFLATVTKEFASDLLSMESVMWWLQINKDKNRELKSEVLSSQQHRTSFFVPRERKRLNLNWNLKFLYVRFK